MSDYFVGILTGFMVGIILAITALILFVKAIP